MVVKTIACTLAEGEEARIIRASSEPGRLRGSGEVFGMESLLLLLLSLLLLSLLLLVVVEVVEVVVVVVVSWLL